MNALRFVLAKTSHFDYESIIFTYMLVCRGQCVGMALEDVGVAN